MSNLNDYLSDPNVLQAFRQMLKLELGDAELANLLSKWSCAILPGIMTTPQFLFAATGVQQTQNLQVDGQCAYLCYGLKAVQQSTDVDTLVNSLVVKGSIEMMYQNPCPLPFLQSTDGKYTPFPLAIPANSTLTIQLQNGSTTAANIAYVLFLGWRVPVNVIEQIKAAYQI